MKILQNLTIRLEKLRLSRMPLQKRFEYIYEQGKWFSNEETKSGAGSTLQATEAIRKELPRTLESLSCNSLLDLGCGDFNWMKEVALSCDYIGTDIAREVIEENKRSFESDRIKFLELDGTRDRLPDECDVILCREVMFHLSHKDVWLMLDNIKKSQAHYLIATTTDTGYPNPDIISGGYRALDLCTEPFNLSEPCSSIFDDSVGKSRQLAIWKVAELPERDQAKKAL